MSDSDSQNAPLPPWVSAHFHSFKNREEIVASNVCGCFYCCAIFPSSEVDIWADAPRGTDPDKYGLTALCPRCGIDSVIGSQSGYPITEEFLKKMHDQWF